MRNRLWEKRRERWRGLKLGFICPGGGGEGEGGGFQFNTLWRCRVPQKNRRATGGERQERNCNTVTMERCDIVTFV